MARLHDRLDAIRRGFEKQAPPEALEIMHRATRDLADVLAREPGLGVGDAAPSFRLEDQDGNDVPLMQSNFSSYTPFITNT